MDFEYVRALRTPYSERFILRTKAKDVAAVDIHYRMNGTTDATLLLFEESGIGEKEVPSILSKIDEILLPDVSIGERNLAFTVVLGRVLGAFEPVKE